LQIGTLERAYQLVLKLNTPAQPFNVLGLIAPGAGWAGLAGPFSSVRSGVVGTT
jgi:hypothetical protein